MSRPTPITLPRIRQVVFGISMMAFSTMFYVQLGPVLVGFIDQETSFVSLGRAASLQMSASVLNSRAS